MNSTLKLSLSDFSFYRFGLLSFPMEKVFAFGAEVGFGGIELTESSTTRWLGGKNLLAMAEHYNLPIASLHQSTPRVVFSSFGSVERLVSRAQEMKAKVVVVHLASVHKTLQPDYFAKIRMLEKASGIKVGFENAMSQFQHIKSAAAKYTYDPQLFCDFVHRENIWVTYDVGHMAGLEKNCAAMYHKLKDRLINVHLHNSANGIDHRPLDDGELPLAELLQAMAADNYNGLITLEAFPLGQNIFAPHSEVKQRLKNSLQFFQKNIKTKNYDQSAPSP